jgi:hypothetical protein
MPSADIIASVPAPKPSPRVVGSSDREPNWCARTGGRHKRRTPTPSRVCSSSSTRVAKPSRRQAGVGWPLVGMVADHLVRHIPDRNKPAAARRRDNPAIGQDWDRRVVDIVVQPPAASRRLAPRRQSLRRHGGAGRQQRAGQASLEFPVVWVVETAGGQPSETGRARLSSVSTAAVDIGRTVSPPRRSGLPPERKSGSH